MTNATDPSGLFSIEQKIERGDLTYSCNCGWIDRTHAGTGPDASIAQMWNTIKEESGAKSLLGGGFKVAYSQTQGMGKKISMSYSRNYFVQSGLSIRHKKEVAMAIFQDVSMGFEQMQGDYNWPVFWKPQSGFSVEDLPSNLLAFYQTVEGIKNDDIVKWTRPLTKKESLSVFREAGGLGTNRTFDPVFFNSKSRTARKCCPNPKWPAGLNTIKPATNGFRPWKVGVQWVLPNGKVLATEKADEIRVERVDWDD